MTHSEIIDPKKYLKEIIEGLPVRLMPDTLQGIFCDMSQNLAEYFGDTIKEYYTEQGKRTAELKYIPLVIAGWCRCLAGINDRGSTFEVCSEFIPEYARNLSSVCPGENCTEQQLESYLHGFLSDKTVFSVDLYACGLAPLVLKYFGGFIAGPGAVRTVLQKYLK